MDSDTDGYPFIYNKRKGKSRKLMHYGQKFEKSILFTITIILLSAIFFTTSSPSEMLFAQTDQSGQVIGKNATFIENRTLEEIVDAISNGVYLSSYLIPKDTDLMITDGEWTLPSLLKSHPEAVSKVESKNSHDIYLITKNIVIGKEAQLEISDSEVRLNSLSIKDNIPTTLLTFGNTTIINSIITSWDQQNNSPDSNPYHPRPFVAAINGGKMNIDNSTISYLGFSQAGAITLESSLAALNYYNTSEFTIANSTISHNLYGFYSDNSSKFKILNNKVFDHIGYGLDPHSSSSDFIIDSNHVFVSGQQGIICSFKCENATISNNLVEYNIEGIGLDWLTNSSMIKDNIIKYNKNYGIFIKTNSVDNIIEGNIVQGNGKGIGILEDSHNNIIRNNTINANILSKDQIDIDISSTSNEVYNNNIS